MKIEIWSFRSTWFWLIIFFSDSIVRLRAGSGRVRVETVLARVAGPGVDQSPDAQVRGRLGFGSSAKTDRRNESFTSWTARVQQVQTLNHQIYIFLWNIIPSSEKLLPSHLDCFLRLKFCLKTPAFVLLGIFTYFKDLITDLLLLQIVIS